MAQLNPIGTDAWHLVGAPIRLPGGVRMPVASTVFRLPDRSLVLYSPIAIDDAMATQLAALGEVAHIVAPSKLHHLFAKPAAERYPRAIVHGAPGLAEKRPDLTIHRVLGLADAAWDDTIDVKVIDGAPALNEAVLFHRPSGTLACADLVFNITSPANLRSRLLFAMTGVGGGGIRQSRVWKLAVKDRNATRAALDRVLGWSIERVAPAHGDVIAIDPTALGPVMKRAYGRRARPALAVAT